MNLLNPYLDLPKYPAFIADTLTFKGGNIIYPGIVNPEYDFDSKDVEIVEGINIFRASYFLFTRKSNNSQWINNGSYYVYSTAPYPFRPSYPFSFGYRSYLGVSPGQEFTLAENIIDWDVHNYYLGDSDSNFQARNFESNDAINKQGIHLYTINGGSNDSYLNKVYEGYINNNYFWDWEEFYGTENGDFNPYQLKTIPTLVKYSQKPFYIDLLSGYIPDERVIPNRPTIIPSESSSVLVEYYRENKSEPIPKLRSIDRMIYKCDLLKDVPYTLPIFDCVLGTLNLPSNLESQIVSIELDPEYYPYKYYFNANLPELFSEWNLIYLGENNSGLDPEQVRTLRVMGANNDFWNNRPNHTPDLNVDMAHPMFIVDNQRAYNWHIKPQLDGSYGDLVMNSPKLEEIHACLDAGKYSLNPLSPDNPRVTNLGHLIEKIAFLFGYRPDPDGNYDEQFEKSKVRRVIPSKQQIDKAKIGVNNFGVAGMLLKRISNRFKGKDIVSDECVIVQDIPQLLAEFQDQINLALGLQESSAIEINNEAGTARYDNQLQVLIELVNIAKANQEMLRAALTSSLVTQGQTSEIIGGFGLPSLTKTFTIQIDGKSQQLPYKGISPHRSLSQEIATATYNAGLATGQLL